MYKVKKIERENIKRKYEKDKDSNIAKRKQKVSRKRLHQR